MKGAGMKLVYIASPLRGENPSGKDYKKNIEQAAKYCENACSLGVLAFAPHLYFTQFYNDTIPEQREKGLEMGLAMLEKCEELWVMGTHISQGMRGEIAHAKSLGIPIYNVEMPDDIMYYPVSADNHALLGQHSCMPDSRDKDYMGKILVMNYEALKPEYRSRPYQLWLSFCRALNSLRRNTTRKQPPLSSQTVRAGFICRQTIRKPCLKSAISWGNTLVPAISYPVSMGGMSIHLPAAL